MEVALRNEMTDAIIVKCLQKRRVIMQLAKATTRAQWKEIYTLYERAFPECERKTREIVHFYQSPQIIKENANESKS